MKRRMFREVGDIAGRELVWIWCPGCEELHQVVRGVWEVDTTDPERLTVSPSILVQGSSKNITCHSFLRAGQWEFLSDSTHPLAGQTVPMEPLPDWCWPTERGDES